MSYIHWSEYDNAVFKPALLSDIKDKVKDIQYTDLFGHDKDNFTIRLRDSFSINKPRGLWASRIDNSKYYTWKDWCKYANFNSEGFEHYFKFDINQKAKILLIDSPDILKDQPNILTTVRYPEADKYPNLADIIKSELENMPDLNDTSKDRVVLNILWIMRNYDGMELIHGKYYSYFHDVCKATINSLRGIFYWWDCDSICVWNPEVIIPEKEKKK